MVFQLVKKYKGQREKHVQLFTLKEISKQILTTVNHLQHKSNDVVIEFFVEECKKMKERLLDMLRNDENMISSELIQKIESHEIKKVYDCYQLGKLYKEAFHEKLKLENPKLLFTPIFIYNNPILLLEWLFIILAFPIILILV